jgi:hypothetical protein
MTKDALEPEIKDDVPDLVRPPRPPVGKGRPPGSAPDSGRPPGSPPGSGRPPGLQDPTGGLDDGPKGVPDTTLGGGTRPGKSDLGGGIQGVHDQGDMPKRDLGEGIPEGGIIFRIPGPEKGGPDAGFYSGISPKYNPSGAAAGKKKGQSKTTIEDAEVVPLKGRLDPDEYTIADKMYDMGAERVYESEDGSSTIGVEDVGGEKFVFIAVKCNGGYATRVVDVGSNFKVPGGFVPIFRTWHVTADFTPRPDGDSKADPRQDPQLILKLTKLADLLAKSDTLRPDEGISDPVPIKGSKAAAGSEGGDLATAGAAKAETAWRFGGKKPGSEVTDPAEWQDRKIRDFSMARIKHFEVIDPSETQGVVAAMVAAHAAARGSGVATQSVTIANVTGNVQRLTQQNGQAGWTDLTAGDQLGVGSVVRTRGDGAEVVVPGVEAASLNWQKVHSSGNGAVYVLSTSK